MKIPNRKKNDRACFWSMPINMYHQTHKKLRYTFRKSELQAWKSAFGTQQLSHAIAKMDTLKGLLRKVEFGFEYCPGCENSRETGHTKECPLAKALHE